MLKSLFSALFILTLFAACGQPNPNQKPEWTLLPPDDGHVYGVGICPIHVKGATFQRALAISRGIDEIARQKGVKVSNTLERVESIQKGASSLSARNYSIQSVEGTKVKAKIKSIYQDPYSKRLYVLMVEE